MRQTILVFSAIAAAMLILLNLRKVSALSHDTNSELWTVIFGLVFVGIGIVFSRIISRKKNILVAPAKTVVPEEQLRKYGITQREYEVLKLVAAGHSNQEISNALFISESTVKTHVSNLMMKLDARRRTQAVQIGKDIGILV